MPVDLLAILRGAVEVADKRVRPHDGTFSPVAVMIHHTATKGAGLTTVQRGRPDLAGPLCNLNLARSGVFNVVSDGLAWHAGGGSSVVLAEAKADHAPTGTAKARGLHDDASGNRWFIGIEVDNDGVGEKAPAAQLAALEEGCAALCRHFVWSANRVIGHKEWTARKIDPAFVSMADLRDRVAYHLGESPVVPSPPTPDQEDPMELITYGKDLDSFMVTDAGELVQDYYQPDGGGWHRAILARRCKPDAQVKARLGYNGNEIDVVTKADDGSSIVHAWYKAGKWTDERLPKPAP